MFVLSSLVVVMFSLILMIYERPYYQLTLEMPYHQFGSMSSSMWFTIISMTTVGYGDSVTSTPVGRFVTVITILVGAYIMSIVIAVQASLFQLNSQGKAALVEVTEQKSAVKAIVTALKYQVARSRRYRLLQEDEPVD